MQVDLYIKLNFFKKDYQYLIFWNRIIIIYNAILKTIDNQRTLRFI